MIKIPKSKLAFKVGTETPAERNTEWVSEPVSLMNQPIKDALRWDIFCTVIDNYGDIGVSWRLAKLLAHQQGQTVRLLLDDLAALKMLVPSTDLQADCQVIEQVTIVRWSFAAAFVVPPEQVDVTLETFGCELPASYVAAMDAQRIWLNLEYLTAESWALDCHGLGALQPNGLMRYFYFPGFMQGTGGLMQEADYEQRRLAFVSNSEAQRDFCKTWQLPFVDEHTFKISLFAYENAALKTLIEQWLRAEKPILVLVPSGRILDSLNHALNLTLTAGQQWQHQQLTMVVMPFLPQSAYDELLWLCDLNFVRGEESFVRAQWAAKPFIWHIYPTDDGAHLQKLQAFLKVYSQSECLNQWMLDWNTQNLDGLAWQDLLSDWSNLNQTALNWSEHLKSLGELSANLLSFAKTHRKRI